jgi:hypothetical protein
MKIASWNVNSIRSRLDHVTAWLKAREPDILLLQELKGTVCPTEAFYAACAIEMPTIYPFSFRFSALNCIYEYELTFTVLRSIPLKGGRTRIVARPSEEKQNTFNQHYSALRL